METTDKLSFVENYLSKYFDEMLINDINEIIKRELHFTFPYVLLVSTGIDFLGGLAQGFDNNGKNNSERRSCYFIEVWMGKVNPSYNNEKMSKVIYKSVRCGASHQAMYKKGVESSSRAYPEEKHLHHLVSIKGEDRIFIHALRFVKDFISAQRLFRDEFIKASPEVVYSNLVAMLSADPIDGFDVLCKQLKGQGLTFDAKDALHNNLIVKSFDPETERIVFADENTSTHTSSSPNTSPHLTTVTAMPSAMPPDPHA